MAVNEVVAADMFYLLNGRRKFESVLSRGGLTGNRILWLAIFACVPPQAALAGHAAGLRIGRPWGGRVAQSGGRGTVVFSMA
jgi:hypothetical protein